MSIKKLFKKYVLPLSLLMCMVPAANAATPAAGSVIGNQATASYTDGSGQTKVATSNLVETIVAQKAGVSIVSSQTKNVAIGGTVLFQHTVTNTGNGIDQFALIATDNNSGNINFTNVSIYADADQNGIPDTITPITQTPNLNAGESYGIIVAATIPNTASNADAESLDVLATSVFDGAVTDSNTDSITVSNNAVIDITKTLSQSSGSSPNAGPIKVTLTYTNTGDSNATNVEIKDALPSGMSYIADSGRWSGLAGITLTDTNADGIQGNITYDFTSGTVTAVIDSIAPGASGTLTFDVSIDGGLAPSTISNIATIEYDDGSGTVGPFNTNAATYTVLQTAAVTINDNTSIYDEDGDTNNDIVAITTPVNQGAVVVFDNLVTNNGNGTDTFEIEVSTTGNTFPAGTVFQLFKSDGATPLADTNSDGNPDTGALVAGGTYKVIVKATLPSSFSGNSGYEFFVDAISAFNNSIVDNVKNTLAEVTTSTVDLTNDVALPTAQPTDGSGAGPEVSAIRSQSVNPGQVATFTVVVNNTSGIPDSYKLEASTDSSFTTKVVPVNWNVKFKSGSTEVTNTNIISAGGNSTYTVEVTIPANETPKTESLYFRVISDVTGAADIIHDEVTVNTVHDVSITPNNTGQVFPNGTIVYTHTLTNHGNVTETSGALNLANTATGWNSILYYDIDGDGILTPADPAIANLSDIVGGLAPSSSKTLLVKVFAPAGAVEGTVNNTTVTITGVVGETNTSDNSATDVSTIITGDVALNKKQAIDATCDGTPDSTLTTAQLTGAAPGACIVYEITSTNTGSAGVTDLEINDTTPNFTTYFDCAGSCPATATSGVVTNPASGSAGIISVDVGSVNPGVSTTLTFVVKIDE